MSTINQQPTNQQTWYSCGKNTNDLNELNELAVPVCDLKKLTLASHAKDCGCFCYFKDVKYVKTCEMSCKAQLNQLL